MKTLLTNGKIVNVFSCSVLEQDVLLEDGVIVGVGSYDTKDADEVIDLEGKYLSPGLIDGHIHIESTMLRPSELAKAFLAMGTTSIVADPHEIANVAGTDGIDYMLQASEGLPLDIYFMLPSCVPACSILDSGAVLRAKDLKPYYKHPRVLGLAEVMDITAVLNGSLDMMDKIAHAKEAGKTIDGHAPLLRGKRLDAYICAGIETDHESSLLEEAKEKIEKGMNVLIREGTAAQNLKELMGLFQFPWAFRCSLCTDDKHPDDLLEKGHINGILKEAVAMKADPCIAIMMATINPARTYGLKKLGAIAPGYQADLVLFTDLKSFQAEKVWKNGKLVHQENQTISFQEPVIEARLIDKLTKSMHISPVSQKDFLFSETGRKKVHAIGFSPASLITEDLLVDVDFDENNGVDLQKDLVKIAVMDRHHNTNQKSLGLIQGTGLKRGAIAASVAHDSHNLIVTGTNARDMAAAANAVISMQGGLAVVLDGEVIGQISLPYGGLMSDLDYKQTANGNNALRQAVGLLGSDHELFMAMAFMSLPVIPYLKITVFGLANHQQEFIPFCA